MNGTELRISMLRNKKSVADLARACEITPSTFYRRMNTSTFTVRDVRIMSEELQLSPVEIDRIFFDDSVEYTQHLEEEV